MLCVDDIDPVDQTEPNDLPLMAAGPTACVHTWWCICSIIHMCSLCTSYNSGLLKINYNKNSRPWPRLTAALWHGLPTMHSAERLFIDQLINTSFHTRYIQWTIVKAHYIIIIIGAHAPWDIYAWISQADHSMFFQVQWGHICLCRSFPGISTKSVISNVSEPCCL